VVVHQKACVVALSSPDVAVDLVDPTILPAPVTSASIVPHQTTATLPAPYPQHPVPFAQPMSPAATTMPPPPSVNVNVGVNVNVHPGMPTIQFHAAKHGPGFLARALWFVCIGWWLSFFVILAGYALVATILFLPLGLWCLHRVPQAQTLRGRTREFTTTSRDGALVITEGTIGQVAWYWRLLYLPIGLVLGALWLPIAWLLGLLVLTLPLSIWMIDRAPGVITLQRQ